MNDFLEFEIRRSKSESQPYYWHVKAKKNGEILAASETLTSVQGCLNAIRLVKGNADTATVWDMTDGAKLVE